MAILAAREEALLQTFWHLSPFFGGLALPSKEQVCAHA
jgi:hypothetical protein